MERQFFKHRRIRKERTTGLPLHCSSSFYLSPQPPQAVHVGPRRQRRGRAAPHDAATTLLLLLRHHFLIVVGILRLHARPRPGATRPDPGLLREPPVQVPVHASCTHGRACTDKTRPRDTHTYTHKHAHNQRSNQDPRLLNVDLPPPMLPCYCTACAQTRASGVLSPDRSNQVLWVMQVCKDGMLCSR